MAKNTLISGTLWEQYSHKVADRMDNPLYRGEITKEEAEEMGAKLIVADWGAESCGDAVRLYWAVDPATNIIKKATFKSFGCGTAIASSDIMAELCMGKTVDEAVKITNIDVEHALRDNPDDPAIPPQKMHCSVMAYDVIKQAAAQYLNVEKTDFDDEEIVCECARVSLRTIRDVIMINDLKTVEEITSYTKAGAFCKSCIRPGGHEKRTWYLEDILRETRAQMELEQTHTKVFSDLTVIQKHSVIEKALDAKVRPALARDGGNIEVIDLKFEAGIHILAIRYLGACHGCASSTTGTKSFIEDVLKREVDQSISVEIM